MISTKLNRIFNWIFLIIVMLTSVGFVMMAQEREGPVEVLSQGLVVMTFLVAIYINLRKPMIPAILRLWLVMLVLCISGLWILPSFAAKSVLGDTRELFVPFAVCLSAYTLLNYSEEQFKRGFMILSVVVIACIFYTLVYSGGFIIVDEYRSGVFKNQTAPFYAQVGLISLCLFLNSRKRALDMILLIAWCAGLIYCIFLRARTATITTLFLSGIVVWERYRAKTLIIIPVILIIAFWGWGEQLVSILQSSLVGNYDATDIDSLSTGRASRMVDSMDFILHHPLWGSVENFYTGKHVLSSNYKIPHNYILWKLVKYGIVYAVPFLVMYIALLYTGLKMIRISWHKYKFVIICMSFAFITSMAEYSAPFGPGTSWIICYCLLGRALRSLTVTDHSFSYPRSIIS